MTECSDYTECPYKHIGPFLYEYLVDQERKREAYKEALGIRPIGVIRPRHSQGRS